MQKKIHRIQQKIATETMDFLAEEAPLEIKIGHGKAPNRQRQSVSVTMRTPNGKDTALAIGFLFSEGILTNKKAIAAIRYTASELETEAQTNVICVELYPDIPFDASRLQRHFYLSSSCGVCGKASIELVQQTSCFLFDPKLPRFSSHILVQLPQKLRAAQANFNQTGGIHAAALFDLEGNLLCLQEDVGRHNALDKVIGWAIQQELEFPLQQHILLLSGRASFELIQKAILAGIAIVAAIGAPSSLAVELAETYGITLVGFLRQDTFNVYGGLERLELG